MGAMLIIRRYLLPAMQTWWIVTGVLILAFLTAAGCTSPSPGGGNPITPATPLGRVMESPSSIVSGMFSLHVADLKPDATLPALYTCAGTSESPELSWENIPAGTKSLVLILEDPDAHPTFIHWLVYNIPPESRVLSRNQPNAKALVDGSQQGDSSAGSRGYYSPPCPPPGPPHHYVFRLFAVDMDITQPTADRASIDWALTDHTLGEAKFVTTFGR